MPNTKADLVKRVLASLVDGAVAWVISFVPIIGALVGTAYTLTKDAVMYEVTKQGEWQNRSLGKKLFNLEVTRRNGDNIDLMTSVKRNIPLAIGTLLMIVPIIGWVAGPVVALIFGVIEIVLVATDKRGIRMGDRWAGTQVVEAASASAAGGPSVGAD